MNQPYIITFAGMVGTSKTPIAHYISINLGLPIFSTDTIRTEIVEDTSTLDQQLFEQRRDQRLMQLLQSKQSFILDASADRLWSKYAPRIPELGYQTFVISLDLSKPKIVQLYQDKNYIEGIQLFDSYYQDHAQFLASYAHVINLSITDKDFPNRLEISLNACKQWLNNRKEK